MNKSKLSRLSVHYLAALKEHSEQEPKAVLSVAYELGSRAVALGLETLDLARIHEQSLAALILPGYAKAEREIKIERAMLFFNEAIVPIEQKHRLALDSSQVLKRLNAILKARTLELAESNQKLQQGISARKTVEAALESREKAFIQLRKASLLLEKNLQGVTREILAANEEERKKMSLQLDNEIAQTLLGIHVKLLSLKKEAPSRHLGLVKKISTIQRLVDVSVETINQFTREFAAPHET